MASSSVPMIYMFPSSFYSQKVRLAMRLKGIKHNETFINIRTGEQNSPSFLKVNPNGQVPALKIGDECFNESEKIIDVIDRLPSDSTIKLVPPESTPEGKEVAEWRLKLDSVDVGNLTYGVVFNPDLSLEGLQLPLKFRPTEEGMKASFANDIKKFEQMQVNHPEMKELCQKKIESLSERIQTFGNRQTCVKIMEDLEKLFDGVEARLQKNQNAQWFLGTTPNAADITLCVLLGRLSLIGVVSRYTATRPGLSAYWNMAKEKPKIKSVVIDNAEEMKRIMIMQKLKKVALITAGIGLVSLGGWAIYKYVNGSSSK